jgi:hypothetical protein
MDRILNELFGDDTAATQAPTPSPATAQPAATATTGAAAAKPDDAERQSRHEARQRRKHDGETHHRRKEFVDRYATGSPSEGFSSDEAIAHLREMRDEMTPAEFRHALEQTLENLPPEQRDEFIAMMRQHKAERRAAAGREGVASAAAADPFGGVLTGLMGGGTGGVGMGDVLDDLAKGGTRAPSTPGQAPTEADFQALINSPLGRAVLGGIAAYGLQDMQAEGNARGRKGDERGA